MHHRPKKFGLVDRKREIGRGWIWRCHIDVSMPQPSVWSFLRPYVEQYDTAIFSMPDFAQHLPIPQYRIAPSIDPLSDKNKPLGRGYCRNYGEVSNRSGAAAADAGRPV